MPHISLKVVGKWENKKEVNLKNIYIYIATWGEDEMDSSDGGEKDEEALLYLMAFDDKVIDSNISCSSDDDDEIDYLNHKLYDSLIKAKKDLKLIIGENESLLEKIKSLEKENHDLKVLVD